MFRERLRNALNRGINPEQDRRTSKELTEAVPQTDILGRLMVDLTGPRQTDNALDTSAGRHKAELGRQGSLADRHLPASLVRRQNSHPSDPGLAGSGGSGCVSVESEGEQADSEEDQEGAAVRFQVDEEDPATDEKQRLHRRDTPHHLKNKRINQQVCHCLLDGKMQQTGSD